MRRRYGITGIWWLLATWCCTGTFVQAQSLSDAFNQGSSLGRSGNQAARGLISTPKAQTTVPAYTRQAAPSSLFGSAGITQSATDATRACAGGSSGDANCQAIRFSQDNAQQRPSFTLGANDPLLTRSRAITADPQAIAGQIAGTYGGCSVETRTTPDRFEQAICHQYRVAEQLSCDKVLIVTPQQTPGCSDGQFLTRVTADPCPACIDYLAFDFSCAVDAYTLHVFTIDKASGQTDTELGIQQVPGALGTLIPKTPGPSQVDGYLCYTTHYSQTCAGANCTIGIWFNNPCQGSSYTGANTFAMPTTISFIDTWDDRCTTLEARTR